jgi:hypothetical protein
MTVIPCAKDLLRCRIRRVSSLVHVDAVPAPTARLALQLCNTLRPNFYQEAHMSEQSATDGANQAKGDGEIPPDLHAARITGSQETLVKLLQEFALDAGCRPHHEVNPDGSATLQVYATVERIGELRAAGFKIEQGENVSAVGRARQAEVGRGDRFKGGRLAPRGLGGKPARDRNGGFKS